MVTVIFVLIFKYRLRHTMFIFVVLAYATGWGVFIGVLLARIPLMDWITCTILSWNFAGIGVMVIFGEEVFDVNLDDDDNSWWIRPLYLFFIIAISAAAAWPLVCLDELAIFLLLLFLILWDIIAVLLPCGPLRYVMEEQQRRIWMAEPEFMFPAAMVVKIGGYELGTGDLIFFGLVSARAAQISLTSWFAVSLSVLFACVVTVDVTIRLQRTIPALPIAMCIGLFIYAVCRFLPMNDGDVMMVWV